MKQADRGAGWIRVVARALLFSILWWTLTDGAPESWWVGIPVVACATIVSMALVPPTGLVVREVIGFVPFFLWHSLKGGADVAWRAFHPAMPITPELVEFPIRLPPGLPQVMLINTVSLLPGTLSADLDGPVLRVHVLDGRGNFLPELKALEQRVGRMWGSATADFPGR